MTTPAAAADRRWELDALRGLMLVAMTLTHLPTRLSDPAGQPLGYVSAAEGFVLLSAYMAGIVYTQRERRHGEERMREAFLRRAWKIWLCQAALLVFLFSIVAAIGVVGRQPAVTDMISFYLDQPFTAFVAGLLLIYSPPLLDILPMYILFMLASPVLLLHGLYRGWTGILAASIALWLAAQFDAGRWLYESLVRATGLPVPAEQNGAFELLGWQFLWVLGLWMGSSSVAGGDDAAPMRFPRWLVRTAWVVAVAGFAWRHAVGQVPFPGQGASLNAIFDKWHLGPLRLIDFFALLVLAMHHAPALKRLPRLRALEMLGAASLPVFCAHLVLALLVLATLGADVSQRPLVVDVALLTGTFAALWTVAWVSAELDRRSAALRERLRARRAGASRVSAGARRSPRATAHSPPH
jgi:hypothetical protein